MPTTWKVISCLLGFLGLLLGCISIGLWASLPFPDFTVVHQKLDALEARMTTHEHEDEIANLNTGSVVGTLKSVKDD
jgi:hypothetical protein